MFFLVPETDDDEMPLSDGDSEIPEVMEENPKEETKDNAKEETESNHTELWKLELDVGHVTKAPPVHQSHTYFIGMNSSCIKERRDDLSKEPRLGGEMF